jgi:CBS domain-containing protein
MRKQARPCAKDTPHRTRAALGQEGLSIIRFLAETSTLSRVLLAVEDGAGYTYCMAFAEQLASSESLWCRNHVSETFIERRSREMQLKEIMTPGVEVVTPEATIQEAAEKMRHLDIGPLPVCDGDRLVGLLTDRDITVRAVAEGRNPTTTQVRDVMTPEVVYGYDDQDSQDAARLMEQYQIRRLPVLNHDKRLVGMVSLGDLAVHAGGQSLAGEVLEQVSAPGKSGRK